MSAVLDYPALTSLTVAPDVDNFYVVDASGPTDKRVTIRDAYLGCLAMPVVTDATTARVLSNTDHGKFIRFTSGSAVAISVPASLRADFVCRAIQDGAGRLTFTGTGGATVRSKGSQTATGSQYHVVDLQCMATNEFRLWGDTLSG